MNGLIWFRNDLRLADNPALITLSQRCEQALMLFVIDPKWFRTTSFQTKSLGRFREEFLYQSLLFLEKELKKRHQKLVIKVGDPQQIIPALCQKHNIELVTVTDHPGVNERKQVANLKKVLSCEVIVSDSYTLFLPYQLSFDKHPFPKTFAQFKQNIEQQNILPCIPISAADKLPECIFERKDYWLGQEFIQGLPLFQGGEDGGAVQLNQFFWKSHGLKNYKNSSRKLDGWSFSSKLSAWLANGSVSVRIIAAELDKYEYRYGANGSTKKIYDNLLWREYFQWMMHHYGARLFAFNGIKQTASPKFVDIEKLKNWQQGTTEYPLVNACMRQLNHNGYLSYLGRKIVASCLVHELNLDWRYGAAFFEQQLLDFDVALNYGHWQYIAGVGSEQSDKIDLERLAKELDPDGSYVARWGKVTPIESVLKL